MSDEPDNLVLQILREMRANMATKDDLKFEINALRADVALDLITTRKELSEQIVGLRRAVRRVSQARVRRIEQRLDLQPEPH